MIKVWDLGVRSFHWLLVLAVAVAAATGFFAARNWLNLHLAAGAAIAALLTYRSLWGFLGPTYARFSSFPARPSFVATHARALIAGRHTLYLGHNPLGAVMVFALLSVLTLIVATGLVALGGLDKQGPLAFVVPYGAGRSADAFHRALAYLLAVMVGGHLVGVAHESIRGDRKLVVAMVTGAKTARGARSAPPAAARSGLAAMAALLLLAGAAYGVAALSARPALGVPSGPLDSVYVKECGQCHMAYPPSLAPRARWAAMMADLGDHFGEEASLAPRTAEGILAYLSDNAAEKWDTRAAHEFGAADPLDALRLTATPYWLNVHRRIPNSVFKAKSVGAKGACQACHADAPTGRFDPQDIRIPEQAVQ